MSRNGKILVAMSGGVDSSVAALMLRDEGYEVIGMTMKTWDYSSSGGAKKETGCCTLDSIQDAREVAVRTGFPHYVLDIREEFGSFVIEDFINEYLAGRTPNPCVLCNTHIKWQALLRRADMLGCEYIATGHYAKVRTESGRFVISRGADRGKDQSYVLWGLSQECLSRTHFPLGNFPKTEIRDLAHRFGFDALAAKKDSYEICFVPDNDYRSFLRRRVNGLEEKVKGGKFVTSDGTVVGGHEGYPFYTIGQRKGLKVALGEPAYVTEIRPDTNTVVLGTEEDLGKKTMFVHKVNPVKYAAIKDGQKALVQIRSAHAGAEAVLEVIAVAASGLQIRTNFNEPVRGIAPGQSAVFYEGEDVVGGGIIAKSE